MILHIIQPAIPRYRVPFFKTLADSFTLKLYASKVDFLNVKSEEVGNCSWLGSFRVFLGIFWQDNLNLFSAYRKGDVVVINGNPRILNYMLLLVILKIRGIKTVWWGHGWTAGSFGIFASLRLKISKIADVRIFYHEREVERAQIKGSFALNNGLCPKNISNAKNSIRYGTSVKRDPSLLTLIFIGRLTDKSGLFSLIEAMSLLSSPTELIVVGDGPILNSVRATAVELNVINQITFVGSLFEELEIAKYMDMADVFVYPGAVGLSIIHAFNYAKPAIIHSDMRFHMPEAHAFIENVNGVSFEMGSSVSLALAIERFQKMSEYDLSVMALNSLLTVEKNYTVRDMVERFKEAINSVL
ncbi:glycosyltransferase [Paraglaciecola sp.]|uniref:glycosyltransferase n=1 Tax=Paraglaciecola sp. TaxID=1920173 RepID=UPI00273E1BEA|nr:glycosyltransferase [Paraglaciecola sp.]MDP5030888.1 glycosyltransferase [Paraglaciecola sp.]